MFGLNEDQLLRLIYLVVLLAVVGGWYGFRRGVRRIAFPQLAIWALIMLALVGVYAYRAPLLRLAAPILDELDPSRVVEVMNDDGGQELAIRRADDGHFHVDADVNGVEVRFLVDTGASNTVLTLFDAERVGIDTAALEFDRPVRTANGLGFSARATVRTLAIGPYRLSAVPVGVMREDALDTSLLGMNAINRFTGWRIDGDRMVLVP